MGNEVHCTAQFGGQASKGKALLETSELLFRGDFRLKIPFTKMKSVKALHGELRVSTKEGLAVFHLGEAAAKWQEKILHPKSRIEKLGVKPGTKVSLVGEFEAEFVRELRALSDASSAAKSSPDVDCIFFAAESKKDLGAALGKVAKSMRGATALWIVYPKGQKQITENDVLAAGRKTGLKDVKVVGFSSTHTALKFVIPLANR
jgi:hypothetical protein